MHLRPQDRKMDPDHHRRQTQQGARLGSCAASLNRKNIGEEGGAMRAKTIFSFTKIIFCFALATIFFTVQSCKRDQATTDQASSSRIYAEDWAPCWSPDGTRIAFHSYREGQEDIYIMNADGSNLIQLTDNTDEDSIPSWFQMETGSLFNQIEMETLIYI